VIVAAQLVTAAGYIAAALILAGVALYGTAMLGAGYAIGFMVAPLVFGLMIAAASVLGLRNGSLPRWLSIAGFPIAAVQLASPLFVPLWLSVLWSLIVGVTLTVRKSRSTLPDPRPAAALA
jgi:MFS superfamily sulfate permease-like transporter